MKKDFYVKNSYADFRMGDTEISITIYDGSEFEVQLNHYRNIKGTIGKTDKIQIKENSLNDTEKKFYEENKETIEQVMSRLLEIHKSVYLKS